MTENLRRLRAIDAAIGLVRDEYRDIAYSEIPEGVALEDIIIELARFACAQTRIAADYLHSTPEAELDDYLANAMDLLGASPGRA